METIHTTTEISMVSPVDMPMDCETTEFSFYRAPINEKNKQPYKNITIKEVLQVIEGDFYKSKNETLLTLDDKQQKDYKKEKLDFVTFSGIFKYRATDGLICRSEYFCVDIDHIGQFTQIEQVKQHVLSHLTPVLMFTSPRHEGLKIVLRIAPQDASHEQFYNAIENYFNNMVLSGFVDSFNNPLIIDKACKDVCRATFLPHDPDCFFSATPTIINADYIAAFTYSALQVSIPDSANTAEIMESALSMIRKSINGQKHAALLRASILTGGFIAGELITESEAVSLLENEICKKDISDFKGAQKTISRGIIYGKERPILKPSKQAKLKGITVPPFPINGLPEQLQYLIKTYAETYGTHMDFWAGAFLMATSLGIGQSVKLQTKYINAPCLWFIFIAPSGIGKTEPLNTALAPFLHLDKLKYENYSKDVEDYEKWKITPKDQRVQGSMEPPVYIQYTLQDFTPESLSKVLSDNPRGVVIYRDELSGWIKDFNRYNKSGEQENYLSAWMGNAFVVNRKTQILRIDSPFIDVAGGMQPDLINLFAKENRDRNGFLVRFCHIFPDKADKPFYNDKVIPSHVKDLYFQYINNLLSLEYTTESNQYINLSDDAHSMYITWFNNNATAINHENYDYLRGVYSKLDIISLRLALTIHFSKWALTGVNEDKITPETMKAALDITEYFRITGTKVFHHLQPQEDKTISNKEAAIYLASLGNSQNQIADVLKCSQQNVQRFLK